MALTMGTKEVGLIAPVPDPGPSGPLAAPGSRAPFGAIPRTSPPPRLLRPSPARRRRGTRPADGPAAPRLRYPLRRRSALPCPGGQPGVRRWARGGCDCVLGCEGPRPFRFRGGIRGPAGSFANLGQPLAHLLLGVEV